jgi:ribosomal protein S12 methylthiotransferase accessory factor
VWQARGRISGQRIKFTRELDGRLTGLLHAIAAAGCEIDVAEVTSDIAVPVFTAVLSERDPETGIRLTPAQGSGCHPLRTLACIRAVTEAAQSRLTRISGSRDDLNDTVFAHTEEQRALDWLSNLPEKPFEKGPEHGLATFSECLDFILHQLAIAGISEIIVVDLTKPEFNVPVVRVIVPGLEGLSKSAQYAPGIRARSHAP